MHEEHAFQFWSKTKYAEELRPGMATLCLEWQGELIDGYGRALLGTKTEGNDTRLRAHRVSWEITYGPIPEGQWPRQKCDNRKCVLPEHLELVASAAAHGSSHYRAKLTEEIVLYIRDICARSEDLRATKRWIIEHYGIDKDYLNKILRRAVWKHC